MRRPKIIFDRSAFHGERFDLLQQSTLLHLSQRYAVSVYHTPVFLEETISMYLKLKNREELKRQLPFILEVCNGKWFRRRADLWVKELVESAGERESSLMPNSEQKNIEANIRSIILDENIGEEELSSVRAEKELEKLRAHKNKEVYKGIRDEFSSELSEDLKKGLKINDFYDWFSNSHMNHTGKLIIESHLETSEDKEKIFHKWSTNKDRFPYFTHFVKGLIFSLFYAFSRPNEKIDINAMADIDQLTFLHRMDILVSNDTRFMKEAFNVLFGGQNKIYLTSEELVDFLNKNY